MLWDKFEFTNVPAESSQMWQRSKVLNVEKPSDFKFTINSIVVDIVISGWVFEINLVANVFKEPGWMPLQVLY